MRLLLAIVLGALTFAAQAQETITILWGFNIGSNQANTIRIMCNELNQMQTKYIFVIGHKPGAGGTIAANAVSNSSEDTLLSMSSSFIIRPLFEKTDPTHNLDNFVPVLVQGTGSPLYVVSSKYSSIKDVLNTSSISIGIAGVGGMSHIVAEEILKVNKTANIIFFKNMVDAGISASGGHIDAAIGLYADLLPMLESRRVKILGHTGSTNTLNNHELLLFQHGMPDVQNLTANYAIFASKEMSTQRRRELHQLLAKAQTSPLVIESLKFDQLTPANLDYPQTQQWYKDQRAHWKKQVDKMVSVKK